MRGILRFSAFTTWTRRGCSAAECESTLPVQPPASKPSAVTAMKANERYTLSSFPCQTSILAEVKMVRFAARPLLPMAIALTMAGAQRVYAQPLPPGHVDDFA